MRSRTAIFGLFVAIGSLGVIGSESAVFAADTWTNLTGTSSVSGELVGIWNGRVLLKLDGGRRVSVGMNDLRADSRIQAEKRFEELQRRIAERRAEIQLVADEESAAAPKDNVLGVATPTAPAYRPVAGGLDLQQTLTGIRDQLLAGHPRVLYDSLPDPQRTAFDRWFTLAVRKVDANSYDSGRRALASLGELILTRQRWLFSHPQVSALVADSEASWLATAAALQTLFADEVTGVEGLRNRSVGESLAGINDAIAPVLHQALSESGFVAMAPDIQTTSGQNGATIANLVLPLIGSVGSIVGHPEDGKWIWWGDNSEQAAARWQQWTQALEALGDDSMQLGPPLDGMLGRLNETVAMLQAARNRQEFHQQLDEVLPELLMMIQQGLGSLAAQPGLAGGGAGGMRPGGMGAGGMPMPGMPTMPTVPGMPGMSGAPGMGSNPMNAETGGAPSDSGFVEP